MNSYGTRRVWPVIWTGFFLCTGYAQNCTESRQAVPAPAWEDIFTARHSGVYVAIGDGVESVTEHATLARFPALSFPDSDAGALSTSVYPKGPPWPFNASGSSTCPDAPPGSECSGRRIPRNPGQYLRSGYESTALGFEFRGSFGGRLEDGYKPGSMLVQSVFFHQNPVYLGGAEYGFYYEVTPGADITGKYYPPRLVFYWSTNSNCGYQPPICRSQREGGVVLYENGAGNNGAAPPPLTRVHGCAVPVQDVRDSIYQVWLFRDKDRLWKFRVRVIDPRSGRLAIPAMTVDPNVSGGEWFPAADLASPQAGGYYTAGVVKSDPLRSIKVSQPVNLAVRRFRAAIPSVQTK
jgi:hypothetical protein